jgi:hypothetical protein
MPPSPEDFNSTTFNGIFVIEQKNKLCSIIDQRFPNRFTHKIHFEMDSIRNVRDLIRKNDLMFSVDLKDTYLHLFYKRVF